MPVRERDQTIPTISSSVKAILDLFKAYESVEILIGIFCLNKTKYNANRGAT